jgi:hypothetical protein
MKTKIILSILLVVIIVVGVCFYLRKNQEWKTYYENGKETTLTYPPGWQVINVSLFRSSPDNVDDVFTAFIPPGHTSVDKDTIYVNAGNTINAKGCSGLPKVTKCAELATDKDTPHGEPIYTYSHDSTVLNIFDEVYSRNNRFANTQFK